MLVAVALLTACGSVVSTEGVAPAAARAQAIQTANSAVPAAASQPAQASIPATTPGPSSSTAAQAPISGSIEAPPASQTGQAGYQADMTRMQNRPQRDQVPSAYSGGRRGYAQLTLAWDQLELGQLDTASTTLQSAAQQGASPIVVGWIQQAIAVARSS